MPWDKAMKTEGEVLKEYAISNGVLPENIFVTKDVKNTADEAEAVKELISPNKKIILVTSAYHMYRAKSLFENQGFNVISFKVDNKVVGNKKTTILDFLPSARNLELVETEVRETIGIIFEYIFYH